MHEMAITQSVIEACSAEAGGERVIRVVLEIGCLCALLPDAVRFCYDVCAQGTPLEGSALEILTIPGRARCQDCGSDLELHDCLALCPCGSANLACTGGDELRIKEMEML